MLNELSDGDDHLIRIPLTTLLHMELLFEVAHFTCRHTTKPFAV
ncbi:hypothetical protein SAMN05216429_1129 [Marinobacter persicus]|jgi:hypothetical protein|uniref:Uncharacterized protein n=1 Tax=Marinobacter persicus TaxID=930118 RepID=A0A1I3XLH3_9GAMM|nr:hypothetical protein SAMN05216429_1129 [Marinobacter persicus]